MRISGEGVSGSAEPCSSSSGLPLSGSGNGADWTTGSWRVIEGDAMRVSLVPARMFSSRQMGAPGLGAPGEADSFTFSRDSKGVGMMPACLWEYGGGRSPEVCEGMEMAPRGEA